MLKSNENMKMKMSGLGTAQSLVGHALSARHQDSDLHTLLSQGIEWSHKGKQTMKKLMFTAAAALCATVGFSEGITSANIVGYTASPDAIAVDTYTLVTTPFESVGGDSEVAIADMVKTSAAPVGYDNMQTDAPVLQVWNGVSYDFYWYINDAGDNYDEIGWSDATGYVTQGKVPCGTGFWYKAPGEQSTFTLAGEVVPADSVTKDLAANSYQLIGNPFPTQLILTKLKTTCPAVGYDNMQTDAPVLQVWNGVSYDFYWYINDAGDNYNETGWSDATGYVVTDSVADATKALWVLSPKAGGTVTFEK